MKPKFKPEDASDPPVGAGPITPPPQVPRFKCTHYVGNFLELAGVVVAVVYDLLKTQRTFTLRSGVSVGATFNLSPSSIAQSLASKDVDVGVMGNVGVNNSAYPVFWQTLYEYLMTRTGDLHLTQAGLEWIQTALNTAVTTDPKDVFTQLPAVLLVNWFSLYDKIPGWGEAITYDDLFEIIHAITTFSDLLDEILAYSFADLQDVEQKIVLDRHIDLGHEVDLQLSGVIEIHLPQDPGSFLTWTFRDSLSIVLHFDKVVMTDDSEFAIVEPKKNGGEWRFPFGSSVGNLSFSQVQVHLSILGVLDKPSSFRSAPITGTRMHTSWTARERTSSANTFWSATWTSR